ncbi:DUF2339 domain-containing protein [Paenibacillus gallinarum]|uniref:DUF2339 domain-containing protein n=1 Tax=Paenibacillus gallinarum TaxID=2762232 RepID=A0ABR8T2B1_9BACL|nr:DUF2339 domain-containing protein [Paenibacillus gallinarum]MBD7969434.1 DUF2339 domain-containing protein [Paenibacillus gallinarum]
MNNDERLNRLEQRIMELEIEVSELKQHRISKRVTTDTGLPSKTLIEGPVPFGTSYGETREQTTQEKIRQKETDWEHLIARVWLPRVFMFVFLIGLIWGFKAAVDGGYITEEMRCIIGLLGGAAFVYLGARQHKHQRLLLSQVLLAGSIGIFMLTTFAAHYLYDFINAPIAFILNVLWTLLGLLFSYRYKSQTLGVLAIVSGILTPFLVDNNNPSTAFFVCYEVLLYISAMIFAIKHRFVTLLYTSFILLHPAFMMFMILSLGSIFSERWIVYGVLVQHLILLASILLRTGILNHQLRVLITSFVLTAVWFRLILDSDIILILLSFTLLYSAISAYTWRKGFKDILPYMLAISSYSLLFLLMEVVENKWVVGLLIIEGFIALTLGFIIKSLFQKINGLLIYLVGFLAGIVILLDGMDSLASVNTFIWIVILLTLAGITVLLRHYSAENQNQTKELIRVLYYGLGVLFLIFITDVTTVLTQNVSENAQHLIISSTWVGYAIAVIAYGLKKKIKQVRLAGIALLFLTLIKVIFFDLPTVSMIMKAVLFIGLGGIGILLSRFFYKKE